MRASPKLLAPEAPQRHPVRVLLLEDDRLSAEIFGAYLRRIPWAAAELATAGTLAEALALLERGSFDLIVSDLNLPDSRGAETVAKLAAPGHRLVIAITSDEDPALQQAVLASGAYEFLHKRSLKEATLQRLVRLAVMQSRALGEVREGEEELRRFRAAVDESADMIVVIDRATMRYVDVNRTICRVLGYSREELLGMGPQDLLPVARAVLEKSYDELIIHQGIESAIRTQYRCKDGSLLPFHSKRRALESGGRWLIVSVARDVRESLAAEQALKESEARFRALTELSSDWYWEQDAELRFVRTAGASDARGGITPESHIGVRRWELPGTEILSESWEEHRAVLAARRPFRDLLLRRTTDDGKVRYVSVSGRPVSGPQGAFQGYHGVASDVTHRVAAELALRESEARFRSLSQLSADVFWEQDADYRFASFTEKNPRPQMQAYLGKRRSELGYVNLSPAQWAAHYADLDARRTFHDLELCRIENGRRIWISASGEPFFGADGAFKGYRGVGRNITARKREEALLFLEHAVTRCLAEAESGEAALQAVIRAICEAEGWECGRHYVVDEAAGVLRFAAAWGVARPAVEAFLARSREIVYRRGEGLTGSAWASGEPIWVDEVARDVRARENVVAGLAGGAFIFPLVAEGRTIGVLSFSRSGACEADARLLKTLRVVGSQLALFLQRQAALDAVRESQATHLRHQERIARFGQSALACRDPQELISEAVQQVLEALAADAAAYLEPGQKSGEAVLRAACGTPLSAEDFAAGANGATGVPVHGDAGVRGTLYAVSRGRPLKPEELNFLDAVAAVLTAGLKRMDSEEQLAFLAQFDPLTGLPNRALLADRFAQMIVQARRHGSQLGVLFVDLDEFKLVNDTLGHAAGDDLLKEAAARLKSAVRDGDTVARISGDEFALVLADLARQEDAALVAQKIIDRLAAPFELCGKEMFVTASVGIAAFPGNGEDAETLLGAADAAMYRAKQAGRNAFQFFTAEINQRTRARAQQGAELRRALERDEFVLAYQPKYDLADGRPCGAEALLRWNHPERGVVSPGEFVPVLEETGLIVAVGEWVLARACRDLKAWAAAGARPLPVAVNLSARQFRQVDLEARIGAVLSAAGVSPQLIELEITESQLMHDPDHAIRTMQSLRSQGIRIAIDDFGTGYSSLAYLTRFPVAALKVDRSFVAGIERQDGDAAIVRAVIEMARTLGFTVIAEGVEHAAQVDFLRQFGCHQAQGFFFARPMPAAELLKLIKP